MRCPMTKKCIIICTIMFIFLSRSIYAQFYFAHKMNYAIMQGNTSYEINFIEEGISGKSKLEFPLDIKVGGIEYNGYYILDSKKTIQVDLILYKDLTDPSSKMTDDDWNDWIPGVLSSSQLETLKTKNIIENISEDSIKESSFDLCISNNAYFDPGGI